MSINGGPDIVTNGLVLHLDAANNKSYNGSGTTWNDLVGNYNITLTNGPIYNSNNKGSILFDGINEHGITNWNILTGNAIFSYDIIFLKYNNNNSNFISYGTAAVSQANQFGIYNNTIGALNFGNDTIISVSLISSNRWYIASVTHDGSTTRLYFNGVLSNTKNTSYNFGASSLYIGQAIINGFNANINIASLKFYNKTLSNNEVLQNFNALKGRFIL
jgi:hypothetical protein